MHTAWKYYETSNQASKAQNSKTVRYRFECRNGTKSDIYNLKFRCYSYVPYEAINVVRVVVRL